MGSICSSVGEVEPVTHISVESKMESGETVESGNRKKIEEGNSGKHDEPIMSVEKKDGKTKTNSSKLNTSKSDERSKKKHVQKLSNEEEEFLLNRVQEEMEQEGGVEHINKELIKEAVHIAERREADNISKEQKEINRLIKLMEDEDQRRTIDQKKDSLKREREESEHEREIRLQQERIDRLKFLEQNKNSPINKVDEDEMDERVEELLEDQEELEARKSAYKKEIDLLQRIINAREAKKEWEEIKKRKYEKQKEIEENLRIELEEFRKKRLIEEQKRESIKKEKEYLKEREKILQNENIETITESLEKLNENLKKENPITFNHVEEEERTTLSEKEKEKLLLKKKFQVEKKFWNHLTIGGDTRTPAMATPMTKQLGEMSDMFVVDVDKLYSKE